MNTCLLKKGMLFIFTGAILTMQGINPILGQERLKVGESVAIDIQTPHPYPNGNDTQPAVWTVVIHHHKATFIKVHFNNFSVEGVMGKNVLEKDFVLIKDKNDKIVDRLTGTERRDWWGLSVQGDTAVIELHADKENNSYGFDIDKYGYGFEKPVSEGTPE